MPLFIRPFCMNIFVKKFGGTSVGNLERIQAVADTICQAKMRGEQIVVVVSAMSGETDRLLSLAHAVQAKPEPRELAALITLGEQVTTNLLVMALMARGCKAKSFTAMQAGIVTDNTYLKARIQSVDQKVLRNCLAEETIPIVAGFQGQTSQGEATALGRGGSDTTAVALAASLMAQECQIYTDVAGIYTADPRLVPKAYLLDRINLVSMLELSSLGAKVLQKRSVELAGKYRIPLRVLSSFHEGVGTLIDYDKSALESPVFSGLAHQLGLCNLICRVSHQDEAALKQIVDVLAAEQITIDAIANFSTPDYRQLELIIHRDERLRCENLIESFCQDRGFSSFWRDGLARLALVGIGLSSYVEIIQRFLAILTEQKVDYTHINSAETSLLVYVPEHQLALAAQALHQEFFET